MDTVKVDQALRYAQRALEPTWLDRARAWMLAWRKRHERPHFI